MMKLTSQLLMNMVQIRNVYKKAFSSQKGTRRLSRYHPYRRIYFIRPLDIRNVNDSRNAYLEMFKFYRFKHYICSAPNSRVIFILITYIRLPPSLTRFHIIISLIRTTVPFIAACYLISCFKIICVSNQRVKCAN